MFIVNLAEDLIASGLPKQVANVQAIIISGSGIPGINGKYPVAGVKEGAGMY